MSLLRLCSWNIHRAVGLDGKHDPARTAAVLCEVDAAVVALQEVDSHPEVEGGLDQIDFLAQATKMRAIRGPTLRKREGDYGNALLTTLPTRRVERHDISVAGREARGILEVELTAAGCGVRVLATHFGLGVLERRRQTQRLLEVLDRRRGQVVVVMGDFNEWWPWGFARRKLSRVMGRGTRPATWPTQRPLTALDLLLARPKAALQAVRTHRSRLASIASDHLPLLGTLDTRAFHARTP